MQSICLAESRSSAQLDITPLIEDRDPVGKHANNFLIPSFGTSDEPRDIMGKWQRRYEINTKGLVFEDSTTPGKVSSRDLCP